MEENQVHIPDGWASKSLIQLAEYINGYGFKPEDWSKDGLPIIRIEQLKNPNADYDYCNFIVPEKYIIEYGDLIFSWSASLFLKIWDRQKSVLNQHLFKVLPFEHIDKVFLKYLLDGSIEDLTKNAQGSTMQHITRKELHSFHRKLPKSKAEQTTIATILSKVEEAIAQTEQLITKYTRIKTGLMQDLLTKGIDEHGNIRSEATHEFKDSPLGRIPKEWECDTLISFCEKIQDGTHFSPKTDSNGAYKYITSKNIRMGHLDLTNLEYINDDAHKKIYRRCSVKYNDVLLTKDGASTGNICLNPLDEEFSLLSSVALIRGKKGKLLNEYIVQFFMEESGQKSLVDQMSGNAITRITLTKINNTQIKVPLFDEQQRIVQNLKPKDNLIINERIKLSKLQSLKAGLMQDLLSGKVRVNHLIKETATV